MDVEKDTQDVAEHFFFFFLKICLQRVRRNDFKLTIFRRFFFYFFARNDSKKLLFYVYIYLNNKIMKLVGG